VLGRLTKARVDQHRSAPATLSSLQPFASDAAKRVQRGESLPRQALRHMLKSCANGLTGTMLRGWVFEVSSIDELKFPPELVRQSLDGVGIAVADYRPKNGPWTRLEVFVLALSSNRSATLSAARPTHAM
jgi:hypothetical protein